MPDEAWQEYLDPEFRDRAPRIERTDEGDFRVFEGKRTPIMTLDNLAGKKPEEFSLNVRKLEDQRAGAGDPAARIKDMDIDGVDAEVLYVGGPLQSSDPALRLNSVRGYNRWLSDYASYAPGRLLGMAAIPIDTPERAVEEIRFAAAQPGLAGGYIPLFPPEGDYGDEQWNPMWEAFRETGLPDRPARRWPPPGHADREHLRERAAVHDRPGDEQAHDGRVGVGADPRPRDAALPRAEVHRGRGPDRLDLVLPVLLGPPLGEAPLLDEERARASRRATTSTARCSPPSWRTRWVCASASTSGSTTSCGRATTRTPRPPGRTRRRSPTSGSRRFGEEEKAKILWKNCAKLYGLA